MSDYSIHSKFDINEHRKAINCFNYLEVCISPSGEVFYAIPSHAQFLENVLKQQCCETGKDYQQLIDDNITRWPHCLCDLTGYCMVWNDFVTKPTYGLTKEQKAKLLLLKHTFYTHNPNLPLYNGTL